jgi:PQQ enzyme repeat/Dockerin type I domain
MLAAGDVLTARNGASNVGVYPTETVLTPSNVNSGTFGKVFGTTLDGQVYAQPLVKTNVNVTAGSSLGIHNVVYVATQHDSIYALDANTGAVLWQDSFIGSTIVPRLNGETVTTLPSSPDSLSTNITPEIGILSTPVIDPSSNLLFLLAVTKESRYKNPANQALGFDTHYVQRLYGVDLGSGAVVKQTVVGDTIFDSTSFSSFTGYQYVAGAVINGTGNNGTVTVNGTPTQFSDGWIANASGYNPMAQGQIAFNALLQMNRPGLTLLNGVIYLGFASHGDKGPYYGWLLGYRTSDLANVVAFDTVTNHEDIIGNSDYTAQAGFWSGGAPVATDGTYLYISTGNGTFNPASSNFDPNYFAMDGSNKVLLPLDNDYGDSVVKLLPDPTVVQTVSNGMWTNGFGVKVVDYFTPTNVYVLNQLDDDLGSSSPTILPDSAAVTIGGITYNHLLIAGGKEGRIYLINRDNMGGFNYNSGYPFTQTTAPFTDPKLYDRTLGEDATNGINSSSGSDRVIGAAAYFNGQFYLAESNNKGWSFTPAGFAYATLPNPSSSVPANPTPAHATTTTFNGSGGNFSISANGATNGIAWALTPSGDTAETLIAYNAATLSVLYTSSALSSTGGTKFSVPTISNGLVYAGTGGVTSGVGKGTLVAFGLTPLTLAAPTNLGGQVILDGKKIHLTWTRNTTSEAETVVERSTDGVNWTVLAYLPNGSTSYDDTAVSAGTTYFYRVTAINGATSSAHSLTATVPFPNFVRGDLNLDGQLSNLDIPAMLAALVDVNGYQSTHNLSPADFIAVADVNGDGHVTNADLQALLSLLTGGGGGTGSAAAIQNALSVTSAKKPGVEFGLPVLWNPQTEAVLAEAVAIGPMQSAAGIALSPPSATKSTDTFFEQLAAAPTVLSRAAFTTHLRIGAPSDDVIDFDVPALAKANDVDLLLDQI